MRMPAFADPEGMLRRHPARAAIGVALLCAAALLVLGGGGDGEAEAPRAPAADPVAALPESDLLTAVRGLVPLLGDAAEPSADLDGSRFAIVTVRTGERVELRRSPGGKLVTELGDRTEFGSPSSFWVARVEGDWLGVPAAELPNGELGWIRDDRDALELFETRYSVRADISERRLTLRYGKRVLEDFPVTVGAPGSPTPTGAYAITDGLAGEGVGPYYGCCILALTGHQPHLPPDWLGGDRIAIHGTPGALGLAASAGCLRASDVDMVSLFARLPLGAPVFIRP